MYEHAVYAAVAGAPDAEALLRRAIAAEPELWEDALANVDLASQAATVDAVYAAVGADAEAASNELVRLLSDSVIDDTEEEQATRQLADEVRERLYRGLYAELSQVPETVRARIDRLNCLRNVIPLRRLQGHTDFVTAVAFSPDGRLALTGSRDSTVRL